MGKSKDLATSSLSSDLTVDTDTFHVDVADNRVGVGIDVPLRKLHIRENAAVGEGIFISNEYNQAGTYSDLKWAWKASSGNESYGSGLRFRQVDTTHGGQLEFYTDSASGTYTKQMQITENGHVTKPNQPSFNVRGAATWTTTTQGNTTTFSHNTVAFNVGNHFNTSNNRFVAPVAGRYLFALNAYVRLETNDDDTNHAYAYIHKNGAAYNNAYAIFGYVNSGDADQTQNLSIVMDMAVNDYATVAFNSASGSSSYYGNGTTFSGFLIG